MNNKKFKYIFYLITVVTLSTIGIQVYWNYKNYEFNKQQLIKDVQISLDKAVDDYYAHLAEKTTLGFSFDGDMQEDFLKKDGFLENITKQIDETHNQFKNLDSIDVSDIKGIQVFRGLKADSILIKHNAPKNDPLTKKELNHKLTTNYTEKDSALAKDIRFLTSKVVISINNDSLNVNHIDSLLKTDLKIKNININYSLNYKAPESKFSILKNTSTKDSITTKSKLLSTTSSSTFLPKNSSLKIYFNNINTAIFKRIFSGIAISTLLVLAVISCLFYMLKIIQNQKQLAEVKNDLISNITHEFKTPISTIGAALEGISNFNIIDNKTKTKAYVNISSEQLSKLNLMVEKLLETATLDSESLELNKEVMNVGDLLQTLTNRYKIQFPERDILLNFTDDLLTANVDSFHFENAINNILDNAIKYGGNTIVVEASSTKHQIFISISDNGNTLTKENKHKIFEKFYRVPKGNTHDVKGFGIGLFYTKSIIEKHQGSISLDLKNNQTTFKISIPHGQ